MDAITICSDFGAQENNVSHCFHCFPVYLPWSDGTRCHELVFWMLSFKPPFSPFSFILVKRLFSSSAVRVVSSAYLRMLIFLLAIWIPACDSSGPALHMVYSQNKVNKQGDNIQPCHTPFPIMNQSVAPCLVLTVVSWPAYRFLWDKNENWPFPVPWLLLSFPNFLAYWVQHFNSIIFYLPA